MAGAIIASTVAQIGVAWVNKLLNKQPKDVSPYFSRNGEYLAAVNREIAATNSIFTKYAAQLPEGSSEANEYLQLSKPALDWKGQRNAIPLKQIQSSMETEGQRLVNQYNANAIAIKPAEIINKATDPISNFFSYLSTQLPEPIQDYLGVPKTDTVIPILLTQEPQDITVEQPGIIVEQPAITIEQKEGETKTGFEKFALPVGIAVVSGIALLMLRR